MKHQGNIVDLNYNFETEYIFKLLRNNVKLYA